MLLLDQELNLQLMVLISMFVEIKQIKLIDFEKYLLEELVVIHLMLDHKNMERHYGIMILI